MNQSRTLLALCTGVLVSLVATAAQAAAPTPVSNWNGGVSLPSDVSMYVYVPANVAAKPPILTLIHFCGGSAQAVFGQAGGLVSAADQYGFVMVVPSNADASGANGRCWDISSTKAQKRDGGGDTHAVAQMVKYALTQYHGNSERVYATGDSSGGMMTQLLLALYPDVFKAGSSFAGVPAGCSNAFAKAPNLCGLSAQTAQQWGDRARAMDPGYTGHRPRVQLFHGDADDQIDYGDFGESIKQWTNVLGLPATATSTDDTLTLGTNPTHKATRGSWKNACGYVVLDTFTEHIDAGKKAGDPNAGGDHGPSDTLFVAKYVVPFLGLDKTGDVDPEITQCSGAGGSGGGGGMGGTAVAGSTSGGSTSGGSASGQSGSSSSGGTVGAAGGTAPAPGGSTSLGGAPTSAGQPGAAGSGVNSAGSSAGGMLGSPASEASSGCDCALGKINSNSARGNALLALGLALIGSARRRKRR